jgi:tripartite-type tricarboxylate transporter receptor subunit TctC
VNTTELPLAPIADVRAIEWTAVPFRAGPEALQALLAGQVDAIADTRTWAPLVETGRLRLLVTFGGERAARFPNVPTLREFGGDWPADYPNGIAGPRGMEPAVIRLLHDAFHDALFDPASLAVLERFHMPVLYLGSVDYAREVLRLYECERSMLARHGRLVPTR